MSKPFPTTISGKLEYATAIKDEGNDLFKMQNYKKAIKVYAKVFAFTKGLPGSKRGLDSVSEMATKGRPAGESITEAEEAMAMDLEAVVHVNTSICYLKLDQPFKTIDHCNAAIALKPTNWKAHLRKGEALTLVGDYEKALKSLNNATLYINEAVSNENGGNATAITGGQKAIADAMKILREKMKIETRKEKEKLSGFLTK